MERKSAASQTPAAGKPEQEPGKDQPRRPLGEYVIPHAEIPKELVALVESKAGKGVGLHPAREDGIYKGKVLHNSDKYLVQAVGREGKQAVVHLKDGMELQSSNLKWREENKRLGSVDIQIHYAGKEAKVWPWNREREDQQRLMGKASEYAKTIKSAKERESFLKHLKGFQEAHKRGPAQPEPEKAQERPKERKTPERKPKAAEKDR